MLLIRKLYAGVAAAAQYFLLFLFHIAYVSIVFTNLHVVDTLFRLMRIMFSATKGKIFLHFIPFMRI